MDTVKTIMQNSTSSPTTIGTFIAIKQAGMTNFFRGITVPFCSYGLINGVTFCTYKSTLKYLDPSGTSVTAGIVAGAVSGTVQLIPAVPVELIKVQQQCTASCTNPSPAVIPCIRTIVRSHGICGLYRGTVAHMMRDVPGLTVYFLAYGQLKQMHTRVGLSIFWSTFFSGAISGAVSWCVSLPFDIIKTRMQSGKLKTLRTVLIGLQQEGNYRIYFRGFRIAMARAFLVNAGIFTAYEASYDWLKKWHSRTRTIG